MRVISTTILLVCNWHLLQSQSHSIVLGRPTATSITASILFEQNVEFYLEYGTQSGTYTNITATITNTVNTPDEIDLTNLTPDTKYFYRMQYRSAGEGLFTPTAEYSFHTQRSSANAQRNVILIIADDLGSDYCGFYENHKDTVAMPNVERLLSAGVRFRYAWSNPLCSPTRAGILTGRYSFRTGVGDAIEAGTTAVLDTAEITIPRLLNIYSPGGIAKANIGKWHLQTPMPPSNFSFPNIMGYDHFEGNFTGMLNSYYDWTKVTNGVASNVTNYATIETVDNAIAWIKAQQSNQFFLWLAFNAPHTPYHLPPSGLHTDTTLSGSTADIAANPKKYFKASVEAMDHEIGRLFDSLQYIQKWDSTDIIFIGDNGDDPMVSQNTGGAKGSIYQEGVSVPFIISGPSVVNPNRVSDALVNTQDLFATILELFGDTAWESHIPSNKPVDSRSLLPIIKNQATTIRPWVFTEVFKDPTVSGDGKAMRNTDYKLLDFDNGTQKFYHISVDTTENNNLLTGTLNATEISNYNYLCNEMSNLVGAGAFCSLTAVDEINNANTLNAFPNPFSSGINVKSNTGFAQYELSNSLGQIIYAGSNIESQDFSSLKSGIYFLKVIEKATDVVKLIKD